MNNYKKVEYVILGYAEVGKLLYEYLMKNDNKNVMFCDNSTKKQKENNELVVSLRDAIDMMAEDTVFYVASILPR